MKHIFLVHSPITYLVSIAVINELKIKKEDAIIIFFEFEQEAKNSIYTSVSVNKYYAKKGSFRKIYNYFRYFNIVTRIDRIVNATIKNNDFIAYVPALISTGKALITHPNCRSFNFIEEGLTNYFKEETLKSITIINLKDPWRTSFFKNIKTVFNEVYLVLRGYNFKLQALPFSYSCYNTFKDVLFYGLSPESFPLVDQWKKIVIPFKKATFENIKGDDTINLNDKIIWIGDAAVEQRGFDKSLYLKGIKEGCIDFFKARGEKNILIKFHRDETDDLREEVKKLFADHGVAFQIIPDSVIMELLLFKARNVTLVGILSSLLFYASIMGHHSFSIYEFLKEEYSKKRTDRDLTFYWEKVKLIEPTVLDYSQ